MFKKLFAAGIITLMLLQAMPKSSRAQSHISFQCSALSLSKSSTLQCDPVSEDDPHDLAESYSYLVTYYPKGTNGTDDRFELRFPSRIGKYHWTQKDADDKNDSLSAELFYNANPTGYEKDIDTYSKDFTIHVTRYDNKIGGIIEGSFEGTMEAYIAWKQKSVQMDVKGNFQTTRTGQGDECRKQRRAEKVVISKAINIFDKTFSPALQSLGWNISDKETGINAQVGTDAAPFRPLSLCSDFMI